METLSYFEKALEEAEKRRSSYQFAHTLEQRWMQIPENPSDRYIVPKKVNSAYSAW